MDEVREQLFGSMTGVERNALSVGGSIINGIYDIFRNLGCEKRDEIIATAEEAYYEACEAIDVPWMPEAAEAQLEKSLWDTIIGPTIDSMADKICGDVV